MATHFSILAWRIPRVEKLGGIDSNTCYYTPNIRILDIKHTLLQNVSTYQTCTTDTTLPSLAEVFGLFKVSSSSYISFW